MFLGTPIDDNVGNLIMAQLLHLESEDPDKDINLYINSPGGDVTALLAIYDTMQYIRCDVSTIVMGLAASAAAVLLLAARRQAVRPAELPRPAAPAARRRAGPGGRHRDPGQGDHASAGALGADHRDAHRPDAREGRKDTDRDFILTADEAKDYGVIDDILSRRGITPQVAGVSSNGA